jgi:hypothetical protein
MDNSSWKTEPGFALLEVDVGSNVMECMVLKVLTGLVPAKR